MDNIVWSSLKFGASHSGREAEGVGWGKQTGCISLMTWLSL